MELTEPRNVVNRGTVVGTPQRHHEPQSIDKALTDGVQAAVEAVVDGSEDDVGLNFGIVGGGKRIAVGWVNEHGTATWMPEMGRGTCLALGERLISVEEEGFLRPVVVSRVIPKFDHCRSSGLASVYPGRLLTQRAIVAI